MRYLSTLACSALACGLAAAQLTVDQTILVLARSSDEAPSATQGLLAYGIPYQLVIVPQSGISLPSLNSSATHGRYGGIIILSELSYAFSSTNWSSALTPQQWDQIYAYQTSFAVRMVRLDSYPQPMFGTTLAIDGAGCCAEGNEQLISLTDTSAFPTANLKTGSAGATMSTSGLYHYPAAISDSTTTTQVAQFAQDANAVFNGVTTAAVINKFSGREQMVFFISWATWSSTSNFLQHAYIHWVTRGLFVGSRKIYFSTQIDDVHLETPMFDTGINFRLAPSDLDVHVAWMKDINTRLPAGSKFVVELGHNGAGDIENATSTEYSADVDLCNPPDSVYPDEQPTTPLEFQKPLGSGRDFWPKTPANYTWSRQCATVDKLAAWFANTANRDNYWHISHTFTHLNLNNATYSDTYKEIQFNQVWLKSLGISDGTFSAKGLIPPAITGMHNGDAIRAFMDLGLTNVVGDNSRSVLCNQQNPYWSLTSTVASNGYAGLNIIPRWSSTIYYNCDTPECDNAEWKAVSNGQGDFNAQLVYERGVTLKYLLALRQDPYMFHQANLRTNQPSAKIGSATVYSLLQRWVETVTQEMSRLTNWPLVSKTQDQLSQLFVERQTRDNCKPLLSYTISGNGSTRSITGATLTAQGNSCSARIGVTLPGAGSATGGSVTQDKLGSEPLIMWATMSGSPVTFTLATPVVVG